MDLNIIIEKAISSFEDESLIVEKSTPVISFGDFRGARVLTLGINPSHREFLDSNKKLLSGKLKRLEDFESLNVSDRSDLNFRHGKLIFEACCNYFKGNNSYRWFSELEPILKIFNSSYSDGTAAHLDLVQWATEKIWSQLSKDEKKKLLNNGKQFLNNQIKQSNCKLIFLNGRTVIREFERSFNLKLNYKDIHGLIKNRASMVYGNFDNNIKIIGCSTNIQSSRGMNYDHMEEIIKNIKDIIDKWEKNKY